MKWGFGCGMFVVSYGLGAIELLEDQDSHLGEEGLLYIF